MYQEAVAHGDSDHDADTRVCILFWFGSFEFVVFVQVCCLFVQSQSSVGSRSFSTLSMGSSGSRATRFSERLRKQVFFFALSLL